MEKPAKRLEVLGEQREKQRLDCSQTQEDEKKNWKISLQKYENTEFLL